MSKKKTTILRLLVVLDPSHARGVPTSADDRVVEKGTAQALVGADAALAAGFAQKRVQKRRGMADRDVDVGDAGCWEFVMIEFVILIE